MSDNLNVLNSTLYRRLEHIEQVVEDIRGSVAQAAVDASSPRVPFEAEAEISRLRAANSEWQDRSLTAQTRVGELQPEVNRLSEALREERQKRDQARRERDTYGEALFEARNKIKTLMQQRDEYDAYCEDWAKDAEEGDAAYYRMKAERDEATAQLAALVEAVKPPRGGCALCAIEIGPDGDWAHDPHCILAGLAVAVQAHNAAQQAIGRKEGNAEGYERCREQAMGRCRAASTCEQCYGFIRAMMDLEAEAAQKPKEDGDGE